MKSLKIGQIAKKTDVGVSTLRFYEQEGLLPAPMRSASGYRQYHPDIVRRIRFIGRAKELGFSLKEIKELLDVRVSRPSSCGDIRAQVEDKARELDARIAALQRIRGALQLLMDDCHGDDAMDDCPIVAALDDSDNGSG